jgi:hypothetical protein
MALLGSRAKTLKVSWKGSIESASKNPRALPRKAMLLILARSRKSRIRRTTVVNGNPRRNRSIARNHSSPRTQTKHRQTIQIPSMQNPLLKLARKGLGVWRKLVLAQVHLHSLTNLFEVIALAF